MTNDSNANQETLTPQVEAVVLLPCPFCGGNDAEISHCEEGCCGAKPRWVQCPCGCELGGVWANDAEAIASWNRRDGDKCRHGCKIKKAIQSMVDSLGQ